MLRQQPEFDAIVLAGGRGRRLGGASKPDLVVGDRRLLAHALLATADAERTVVVGPAELVPERVPATLVSTRERPPYGGPVAGIAAGLSALGHRGADLVLVLACDVPRARLAAPVLLDAAAADRTVDGAQLVDDGGRTQPLVAAYRRGPLRGAVTRLERDRGVHGASMRELTSGLRIESVPDRAGHGADVDTWDDLRRVEELMASDDRGDDGAEGERLIRWVDALATELGVDPVVVGIPALLALASDVAHAVERPAAPLTTFLVGFAAGRATAQAPSVPHAAQRASSLAARWAEGDRPAD